MPTLIQIDGYASTLFDSRDPLLLGGRLQFGAVERDHHGGELLGLAEGAGLEGAFFLPDVPGDVEGVALAVAEAVDDGTAVAALLVDGLLQRLGFAPVSLQVFALGHVQGLLAGLQHLLPGHGRAPALATPPIPGARLLGRLSLLGVIVLGLVWWRDGPLGPLLLPFGGGQQGPQEEKQGSHSVGRAAHANRGKHREGRHRRQTSQFEN